MAATAASRASIRAMVQAARHCSLNREFNGPYVATIEFNVHFRKRRAACRLLGSLVGLHRIELWTSSLSGMRSNRLSYSPSSGRKG